MGFFEVERINDHGESTRIPTSPVLWTSLIRDVRAGTESVCGEAVGTGVPAIDRTNEIAHSSEFWGWDLPERIKGAPCERETAGMGEQGEDMKDPGGVDFRLFDVRRGWVVRRSTGLGIF